MARQKRHTTSTALAAEIRRLEEERQRAQRVEDERRGALIRGWLVTPDGAPLKLAIAQLVSRRDASLFDVAASDSAAAVRATATASSGERDDE